MASNFVILSALVVEEPFATSLLANLLLSNFYKVELFLMVASLRQCRGINEGRDAWFIAYTKFRWNIGWGSKFGTTKCRTTRNFEITNIKIKKNEFLDNYFRIFFLFFRNYLKTQNILNFLKL